MASRTATHCVITLPKRLVARLAHLRGRPAPPPAQFALPTWHRIDGGPLRNLHIYSQTRYGRAMGDRMAAGAYEPELICTLSALAAGGGHLYDIGAHTGYVAAAWMHLGGGGVDAFEPVENNARIIRDVADRNGFIANFRVHVVAISDRGGFGCMRVNESNLSASSMAYLEGAGGVGERLESKEYAASMTVATPVQTLDEIVSERALPLPAVVKIDVEGAEAHVLRGASQMITQARPVILCELHNVHDAVEVAVQMSRLGYRHRLLFRQKKTICNYVWTADGP